MIPSNTPYTISSYVSDAAFSPSRKAFLAAVTSVAEPKSYFKAVKNEVWPDLMVDEDSAHILNGTWEVTTSPPGNKLIGIRCVYKIKYHFNGKIFETIHM